MRAESVRVIVRKSIARCVGGLIVGATVACGPSSSNLDVPESSPLAHVGHVHRRRCGSCHARVEPGTRTRAELEVAFTRHRARVHLTDEEWEQMIEYLAAK